MQKMAALDVASTQGSLNSTRYGVKLSKQEVAASIHAAMYAQRKSLVDVFSKKLQGTQNCWLIIVRNRNEHGRCIRR